MDIQERLARLGEMSDADLATFEQELVAEFDRLDGGEKTPEVAPEITENFVQTALAYAARMAEAQLLTKIATSSTSVSSGQLLGAARDFTATIDQAAAAMRYRQRMPRSQRLTVVLPDWAKDLLRADLARELANDTQGSDPLAISDARIDAWLSTRGLSPIWTLDGQNAVTGAPVPYAFQGFGAQAGSGPLNDWPHTLVWYLWPDGTFQHLDGGRLDFAMVRDSTLDSTNDCEVFVETFETAAFRGLESLQIVSSLRPNGGSAGTINTTTY